MGYEFIIIIIVLCADDNPSMFTSRLNHCKIFTKYPMSCYIEGRVSTFESVDIDEFSVHKLDHLMKRIWYNDENLIYYHFLRTCFDLDWT